jgi:hypothetical protein
MRCCRKPLWQKEIMSRTPDAVYEGYAIFAVVVPLDDGRWLATSEVERHGADGIETFQQFGGPSYGHTEDGAKIAALTDTRRKIDNVLARPVA